MPLLSVPQHARLMLAAVRVAVTALSLSVVAAQADVVTVQVLDVGGVPVPNAVVYAEPTGGQTVPKMLKQAEIEQKNIKFFSLVSVVQVGTQVLFPNHDKVRHHVYWPGILRWHPTRWR